MVSHDVLYWVRITTEFARKIVAVAFFKIFVHGIFPQLAEHLTQIFPVGFSMIYAFDIPPPNVLVIG